MDAAVAAPPAPARPGVVRTLLQVVPAPVEWLVVIRGPSTWSSGLGRLWSYFAAVPELAGPLGRASTSLGRFLGSWPLSASALRTMGVDPAGALALARVPGHGRRPPGYLVVLLSQEPTRLFRKLSKTARIGPGQVVPVILPGGATWACSHQGPVVVCASEPELRAAALRRPGGAVWERVFGRPGLGGIDGADALVVVGADPPVLAARIGFSGTGIDGAVWLGGRLGAQLSVALTRPEPPPGLPVQTSAFLQVGLNTLAMKELVDHVGQKVPVQPTQAGTLIDVRRLGKQLLGQGLVAAGRWGGFLCWARRGRWPGPSRQSPVALIHPWGPDLWAYLPPGRAVLASSPSAARRCGSTARKRGTLPGGAAARALLGRAASARLFVRLVDPLELLSPSDRLRLIAAVAGLPASERTVVAFVRAASSLLGEIAAIARPRPAGVVLRMTLRSPAWGRTVALRRSFRRAWEEKWRTGGFFAARSLRQLASDPSSAAGRLAQMIRQGPPDASVARSLVDQLLWAVRWLRGAELSCARLSRRLTGCAEAFGRGLEPERWRRADRAGNLTGESLRRRRELLGRARRAIRALGARCDDVGGRLESVRTLKGCFSQQSCAEFASCVLRSFQKGK